MDIDYYEVTSEIDAREILRYLNNLGIHNISGEVLKYFITDLKKLIKYDLERKYSSSNLESQLKGPERLHSASTFSSRIRSKVHDSEPIQCTRECQKPHRRIPMRPIQSAPNLGQKNPDEKPPRRACSCVKVEKKHELKEKNVPSLNKNLIKVAKQPVIKKCDPVSLYHYYTTLWNKYKSNVPGENDWSDLRWSIRQKMAGNISKQLTNKVPESDREKEQVSKS